MTLLRKKRPIWVGLGGGLPIPAAPGLTAPAAVTADITPLFQWPAVSGAATYDLQVATTSTFDAPLTIDETGIATNSYTPGVALDGNKRYYARVRGVNANGVAGAWSATLTFDVGLVLPTANLLFLFDPATWRVYSDAAMTTPIADGGAVRGISDQGSGAYHLTQAGADTLCPTYRASVAEFGNRPALEYDGGDYLFRTLAASILGNLNGYTVYVVYRHTLAGTGTLWCEGSSSGVKWINACVNDGTTGDVRAYHVADDGTYTINLLSASKNNNDGASRLHVMRRTASNAFDVMLNDWEERTNTSAPGVSTMDRLSLGARFQGGTVDQQFKGQIALVAAYSEDNYDTIMPLLDAYFGIGIADYVANLDASYLTVGDSKTLGINDTIRDRLGGFGYQPLLSTSLTTATGDKWREYPKRIAVSGYTVATMKTTIDARLAAIDGNPTAIHFNLGTNDLAALPAENTWKTDYRYNIEAAHTKFPAATIYLAKPVRLAAAPPSTPVADTATLHGWIDDLVAEYAYVEVGIDETALEGGDGYATNFADDLHPSHAGYVAEAPLWQTAMGY